MTRKTLFAAERRMLERQGGGAPAANQPAPAAMDESKLLAAIDELKAEIRKSLQPKTADAMPEFSVLQGQLYELRNSIEKTKQEIAAVRRPGQQNDDRLTNAGLELNAIVETTEEATNDILNATEEIDERIHKIRQTSPAPENIEHLDEVNALTVKILEACNFQDLSGQRITKVVKIIHYLEDRISTMIDIWGAEEFENVEVAEEAKGADDALLHGPQRGGEGVSQDDIDSLFD